MSVYSSGSGVDHAPAEGVLVMKTGAWSMGDEVSRLVYECTLYIYTQNLK